MRLLVGASVLATATGCGGAKKEPVDPYAASLAKGSEHVEITAKVAGRTIRGHGDFTNSPDRGHYVIPILGASQEQVYANGRLYVRVLGRWMSKRLTDRTPQTPAQMFRRRLPATFENGLVKSITLRSASGTAVYTFSRYGEHVSVTVPRVKGS